MKNYIEELKQQFPTLYSVMEKTEVFGIPIAVRFSEWFEQAIQSAKKEAVEEREKELWEEFELLRNTHEIYLNGLACKSIEYFVKWKEYRISKAKELLK